MKRILLIFSIFSITSALFPSVEPDREFKEGFAFLLLKNQDEAKKLLEPWISRQKSPLLREAFKALLSNDKLLASSNFESFLNQDERNVEALLGYGLSLEEMYPSYQEFYFRQALKVNPNLSIGRIALGYNLLNQEKIKEAEREFLSALRRENFPVYKYFLFNLYVSSENWEGAFKVYNEFFEFFPKDWSIPLKLGRLLLKKGIREKGIELMEKAYELNPSSTELLVEIGTALLKDGKLESAIKYFDRASSINKNDPLVLKGKGIALIELGNFENAYKELIKAWNKRKNDCEISFYLSKALASMGKEGEAKEWLLRAVMDGFKEWKEIQKIPLFKDLTTKEKVLSFFNINSFPFYSAEKLDYLEPDQIVVLGRENKGEEKTLFIFNNEGKKLKKISLKEETKDFFFLGNTIFLLSSDRDSAKHNIYILEKTFIPKKINSQPIDFYEPYVYSTSDNFFIWDRETEKAIKRSPFSLPISANRRLSFYPNFSFNIFQFSQGTSSLKRVSSKALSSFPIPLIKSCELLEKLYLNSKEFKKIVDRGKALDISSAETIEVFPFPEKGVVLFHEKGPELTIYTFDTNGKKIREQKFKMDAIYSFTNLDMDAKGEKILSILSSQSNNLILFDLKKKKTEKMMENVKKFEKTPSGYLLLNEKGEIWELKDLSLKRVLKKGLRDFRWERDYMVYHGLDGWLYYSKDGKEIKLFPCSESIIYKLKEDMGVLFSPQAGSIFIMKIK
jgi:tetratricopeptide (TPR) repeat protein